jgi:hypothetical protein
MGPQLVLSESSPKPLLLKEGFSRLMGLVRLEELVFIAVRDLGEVEGERCIVLLERGNLIPKVLSGSNNNKLVVNVVSVF